MNRTKWKVTFPDGEFRIVDSYEYRAYNGYLMFDTTGSNYPERYDLKFPMTSVRSYEVVS